MSRIIYNFGSVKIDSLLASIRAGEASFGQGQGARDLSHLSVFVHRMNDVQLIRQTLLPSKNEYIYSSLEIIVDSDLIDHSFVILCD